MPSRHVWARSKIPKPSVMRLEFRSKKGRGILNLHFRMRTLPSARRAKGSLFLWERHAEAYGFMAESDMIE